MNRKEFRNIAIGVGGAALAAAAAAAAGAVLSNKDLRKKLSKRANEALEIVAKIAKEMDKGTQGTLKVIEKGARSLSKDSKVKKLPRKISAKKK